MPLETKKKDSHLTVPYQEKLASQIDPTLFDTSSEQKFKDVVSFFLSQKDKGELIQDIPQQFYSEDGGPMQQVYDRHLA